MKRPQYSNINVYRYGQASWGDDTSIYNAEMKERFGSFWHRIDASRKYIFVMASSTARSGIASM